MRLIFLYVYVGAVLVVGGFMGTLYAIPLVGFLIAFRPHMAQYEATPLPLHELFFAPTDHLIHEIGRQQEALETREQHRRQLTESIGEIFFSMDERNQPATP